MTVNLRSSAILAVAAVLGASVLVLAGCGDDDVGATDATTTTSAASTTTLEPAINPTTAAPTTTTTTLPATTTTTTTVPEPAELIVFTRMVPDAGSDIFTIDPVTGEETQLTEGLDYALMPVWSPMRDAIAFWSITDDEYIWIMNADGSDLVQATFFSSAVPDWGRGDLLGDGHPWMVFNSDSGGEDPDVPDIYGIEWIRPTDTLQFIDSDPTLDFRPRVSPDGTKVLFGSDREDPNLDIWVFDIVANTITNLTAGQGGLEMNGDWSPDGTRIAFTRANAIDFDIWVMNADGSDPQPLVEGPGNQDNASWSPDGTMLVYQSDDPGNHLWVVNADGSDARQLTDGSDFFPDWW